MAGQTNLEAVLSSMKVACDDIEYGFATVPADTEVDLGAITGTFLEPEGLTIIAPRNYLQEKGIANEGPYAKLTIKVHTSLELVGLTAVLAAELAKQGISANVVAAYFHDHVFVQYDQRQNAVASLKGLRG